MAGHRLDKNKNKKAIADHRNKWDRFPDEPNAAFENFKSYRDLGLLRTIKEVEKTSNTSYVQLVKYSSMYHWRKRARAYDDYLDRRRQRAARIEAETMGKRHVKMATRMQHAGALALEHLLKKLEAAIVKDEDTTIEARDVVKLLKEGIAIERLARGEPGEIVEETVSVQAVDLTGLSKDDLREIRRLRDKAAEANESIDTDGVDY